MEIYIERFHLKDSAVNCIYVSFWFLGFVILSFLLQTFSFSLPKCKASLLCLVLRIKNRIEVIPSTKDDIQTFSAALCMLQYLGVEKVLIKAFILIHNWKRSL